MMLLVAGAALGTALAAPQLDRVDLLAESPGRVFTEDLRVLALAPAAGAARLVGQVQPVWSLGPGPWHLAVSVRRQDLRVELPLPAQGWSVSAGVSTRLLYPEGLTAALAWRPGRWRIAAGAHLGTGAGWARPRPEVLRVGPVLAVGVGAAPPAR